MERADARVAYDSANVDDFGSERGLFRVAADDRVDGSWSPESGWRKNADFLRLKDFALHLAAPRAGMNVLDIGCSDGAQMVFCGLQGATVYGQDLNAAHVAVANEKLARLGIDGEAREGDAARLAFEAETFDVVLSSDFHEHLDGPTQLSVLREARRVLRPGGRLVLKTPNLSYLKAALLAKRVRAALKGRDPRGYVIPHTSGSGPDDHVGLVSRPTLQRQLDAAGFQNWSFHYPPLRRLGVRTLVEVASSELPLVRDVLSEDVVCVAHKPIALSYFPD